jgi:hypothetical protein
MGEKESVPAKIKRQYLSGELDWLTDKVMQLGLVPDTCIPDARC